MKSLYTAMILGLCLAYATAGFAQSGGGLAGTPGSKAWIEQLKDPVRRVQAQWSLRLEKDPQKIPDLMALLQSEDAELKITVLQILSEAGNSSITPCLVPLLRDPAPQVREAAALALGALGDSSVISALIEAIKEGMEPAETAVYWLMPSDITENYRYACVEALNRITKQDFKYTRAQNNFGRMHWLGKIDQWWKQQQVFYGPEFKAQAAEWQEIKKQLEDILSETNRSIGQESPGLQEFQTRVGDIKEHVEAIVREITSANVNAGELKQQSEAIPKELLAVDEIFVYAPELALIQAPWMDVKGRLESACKKLSSFL